MGNSSSWEDSFNWHHRTKLNSDGRLGVLEKYLSPKIEDRYNLTKVSKYLWVENTEKELKKTVSVFVPKYQDSGKILWGFCLGSIVPEYSYSPYTKKATFKIHKSLKSSKPTIFNSLDTLHLDKWGEEYANKIFVFSDYGARYHSSVVENNMAEMDKFFKEINTIEEVVSMLQNTNKISEGGYDITFDYRFAPSLGEWRLGSVDGIHYILLFLYSFLGKQKDAQTYFDRLINFYNHKTLEKRNVNGNFIEIRRQFAQFLVDYIDKNYGFVLNINLEDLIKN